MANPDAGCISSPEVSAKLENHDHHGSTAPNTAQSLIDLVLHFLSTSSNEALAGVFLFSTVATYFILGKAGLLLIGIFLGIILHVAWDGPRNDTLRKRELGLLTSDEFLSWPENQRPIGDDESGTVSTRVAGQSPRVDLEYSTFRPAVGAALQSLTDATIDSYVK